MQGGLTLANERVVEGADEVLLELVAVAALGDGVRARVHARRLEGRRASDARGTRINHFGNY